MNAKFKNISPSRMPRIVNCPGSVNLLKRFPGGSGDQTIDAELGSLAHWLSQKSMAGEDIHQYIDKSPINDHVIDAEMIRIVKDYRNYCERVAPFEQGWVETRLKFESGEYAGFGGTPDFIVHDRRKGMVTIVDFKYGFLPVHAAGNWQLLAYAWLLCGLEPEHKIKKFNFVVYQPRIGGPAIDSWQVPFDGLQTYFKKIEMSLDACMLDMALTRAGDHCHYCDAMLQCETNLETCLRIVNLGGMDGGEDPNGLAIARQLKLFQFSTSILKMRLKVIESIVETRLKAGENVPGYYLKPTKGHRYWAIPEGLESLINVPDQPPKKMSPKQAEDSGFSKRMVNRYTKYRTSLKVSEIDINAINDQLK